MHDAVNCLSRSRRYIGGVLALALALILALLFAMVNWQTSSGHEVQAEPGTPPVTQQPTSVAATPAPTTPAPTTPATFAPTATAQPPASPTPTAVVSVPTVAPSPDLSLPPTATPQPAQPTIVAPTPTSSPPISETAVPGTAGAIALTFDCGYGAASLNQILTTLADADARATFFLEGNWVERSPQVVAPIVAAGHVIGSHSYAHPNFTTRTEPQVTYELTKTAALIADAGGPASLSLFRYPYGARSQETDAWVTAQGYTIVGWSIDPQGWRQSTTPEQVLATVLRDAKPGGIVLMHCGSVGDQGALPQIITSLRARGYTLVTVPEVLGTPALPAD